MKFAYVRIYAHANSCKRSLQFRMHSLEHRRVLVESSRQSDPLEWQRPDSFFYSMPFPPLDDYDCVYSVQSLCGNECGAVSMYDQFGIKLRDIPSTN